MVTPVVGVLAMVDWPTGVTVWGSPLTYKFQVPPSLTSAACTHSSAGMTKSELKNATPPANPESLSCVALIRDAVKPKPSAPELPLEAMI